MNMYHNIMLGVIVVLILDMIGTQLLMHHQNSMPKKQSRRLLYNSRYSARSLYTNWNYLLSTSKSIVNKTIQF